MTNQERYELDCKNATFTNEERYEHFEETKDIQRHMNMICSFFQNPMPIDNEMKQDFIITVDNIIDELNQVKNFVIDRVK